MKSGPTRTRASAARAAATAAARGCTGFSHLIRARVISKSSGSAAYSTSAAAAAIGDAGPTYSTGISESGGTVSTRRSDSCLAVGTRIARSAHAVCSYGCSTGTASSATRFAGTPAASVSVRISGRPSNPSRSRFRE